MKFLLAVLAGLAGTAAMTLFLYLLSFLTSRTTRVVKVLGTMLTNRTQPDGGLSDAVSTSAVGIVAHYAVGAFFAVIYLALWDSEVGLATASWGILFGLANGIAGMVAWYFFFMLHRRAPVLKLGTFLMWMLVSHVIFGFVTTYVYHLLSQPVYAFWQ